MSTALHDNVISIFNKSQHVTSMESSLTELIKVYQNADHSQFIESFEHCLKNLLQASPDNKVFFNTACEFVCNFLEYVSNRKSNAPTSQQNHKRSTRASRTNKRKRIPVDELCEGMSIMSSPVESYEVTNDDRFISSVVLDVINHYMLSVDDNSRCNAVQLVSKMLSSVSSLDQEIYDVIKTNLLKRIRDKKSIIRAYAVLASKTFQDTALTKAAFLHHFNCDPEPIVRKALIQTMDTKVFQFEFLINSTRDPNESIRKAAYHRLGLINPLELNLEERHTVIHNGLNERCRQLAYVFRSRTLEPWTKNLYDRIDLLKLVESLDVINYMDDMQRLVDLIYTEDLENIHSNGITRLHSNVEFLRAKLLNAQTRLPNVELLNDKTVFVWMTLLNFCKKHSKSIQPVKLVQHVEANTSIEKLIDADGNTQEEEIDLYERLCPDLVTLADYIKKFVHHSHDMIEKRVIKSVDSLEFVYQQLMQFIETFEVVDELERKYTQEVFRFMLKENLLTGSFDNFIPPIVRCLSKMIYKTSPNLMVSFVSDMINDVRSNLEDLSDKYRQLENTRDIAEKCKSSTPFKPRQSLTNFIGPPTDQFIEDEIANYKVVLEDAEKDVNYDEKELDTLKTKLKLLQDRRNSIAFSDVASRSSSVHFHNIDFETDEVYIFKHHRSELVKCLQMFAACFQYCDLSEVPATMSTHLTKLSLEGMEWKEDPYIRSLVIRCTGLAALASKSFALLQGTLPILIRGCDDTMIEVSTRSYRCLVDVIIQHKEVEVRESVLCKLFGSSLRRELATYKHKKADSKSQLDHHIAITEGASKLFYFEKLSSPEILAELVLWWYNPLTHSRVKQYIGVFLPILVEDLTGRSQESEANLHELLRKTFLISIERLHRYILTKASEVMSAADMYCMIRFMCSLIPVVCHSLIAIDVARRIRELSRNQTESDNDLCGYLIASFPSLDIKRSSSDNLDDLENALSELECIIDRLSTKNKQLKSQYTKFRHQVEIAERVPDLSRKRAFDELQSTTEAMTPPLTNPTETNENSDENTRP